MAELFGFRIERPKKAEGSVPSFTSPTPDDGTIDIAGGGFFGQFLDQDGRERTDLDLIRRYRDIATQPECDTAIEDIINEGIVSNENDVPVQISLDNLPFTEKIKRSIRKEFMEVLRLLHFESKGHDIFRRWYVDGRIFYHKIIDTKNPKRGIQELRYIEPKKIKKVKETKKAPKRNSSIDMISEVQDYYIYSPRGVKSGVSEGIKILPDSITYVPSGLVDQNKGHVLSYLHKAIKPVNQLRMIEDALVIYRISRAPERRIFYIDVGNLPKGRAEEYVRNMMSQYRNKIVYDASSGEVRDDRRHKSMLEDFFLPRREGGRGTEITTLPGGENLGQIDDILFFQKKLYKSLNVPLSRLDAESGFQVGRATEINREEVKFNKFVQRLRKKFSNVLIEALKTQLILKGVINEDDWPGISENIFVDYLKDNYFAELKEFEIMRERFDMMGQVESFIEQGYYSKEWVRKNILGQDDQEIDMIDKQIADEKAEGEGENEFDDLAAGKMPPEEKGDLESDLDNSDGTLESQI